MAPKLMVIPLYVAVESAVMEQHFWSKTMATTSILLAIGAAIAFNTVAPESPANLKPSTSDLSPQASSQTIALQDQATPKNWQPALSQGRLITMNRNSRINIRAQPTVHSPRQAYGIYGDEVTLLTIQPGLDDHYRWYQIELPSNGIRGWVREDLVLELAPSTPAMTTAPRLEEYRLPIPNPAPLQTAPRQTDPFYTEPNAEAFQRITVSPTPMPFPPVSLPTVFSPPMPLPPTPSSHAPSSPASYTESEIDYFTEIALGSEFGNASERVRKWEDDIRIRVHGTPTAADQQVLAGIVTELDTLLNQDGGDGISIDIVDGQAANQANVDIYFVHHNEFARYEPNYQPGNMGFAYVNWRRDRIYRARILITTVGVTQAERSHLIREELTQSLGLLRDSYLYDDSIFYQGWTSTNAFSPIDRSVIQMLYSRTVTPGMNRHEVTTVLEQGTTVAAKEVAKSLVGDLFD
ncbi:MAG: DUF2927 domain-containing protein [Leptolyngbyaceae cyanobacterium]